LARKWGRYATICALLLLGGCAGQAPAATTTVPAAQPSAVTASATAAAEEPAATTAPGELGTATPESDTGVEGASRVLRGYYAALDARQYEVAYAYWESGGAASGQTFEEFSAGFAETERVAVELGEPGRIGAAAGSVYISIPVIITATQKDGSVREFSGSYTLRRTNNVDGSSAWDRAWHLYQAQIVEV
jgi:hypothetical protein